jgi:hypothetical protein
MGCDLPLKRRKPSNVPKNRGPRVVSITSAAPHPPESMAETLRGMAEALRRLAEYVRALAKTPRALAEA